MQPNPNSILYKHILIPREKAYGFRQPITLLLALVSGVDQELIHNSKVYSRTPSRYLPWYPAAKGGGAITLGTASWQSITFTENFFADDIELYGRSAYANNLHVWLRLSAHEVGHLAHAQKYNSLIVYLLVFAYQYLRYGHDAAPLEKEADSGAINFSKFNSFLRQQYDSNPLQELLLADITDKEKCVQISTLWNKYLTCQDSRMDSESLS